MPRSPVIDITPSARRLTTSLRDVGYDFPTALADLVDNSLSAGATRIDIVVHFGGSASYVLVADDGNGMTEGTLNEALRLGTRREYLQGDLGRFGLGLKTASLSQGRRVTVVTRHAPRYRRTQALSLDLDEIQHADRWRVRSPMGSRATGLAAEWLDAHPGTVVVLENLDRLLPTDAPDGGWARRRFTALAAKAEEYLGMVFHRFLEGESDLPVTITVNGRKVRPWNPFAPTEGARRVLPRKSFEVEAEHNTAVVNFRPYVLPPRRAFSSQEAFELLSGPRKWNRQQGLYIYRAGRMIQSGGWCGLRAQDEHTKLARASLDFDTDLDSAFRINVAKMRVSLPTEVRTLLERPIQELCHAANVQYRRDNATVEEPRNQRDSAASPAPQDWQREVSAALTSSALAVAEFDAFVRIMQRVKEAAPAVAEALGW